MRDGIYHFAGFDDWIEIFRSGKHTDMRGRRVAINDDDLNKIVSNFSDEDRAPAVIGHPETDDPAVGWVDKLKVDSGRLFAKFTDLRDDFKSGVEQGSYRNRSSKIIPTNDGYKLMHVGWLGAKLPAIAGMKSVEFGEYDNDTAIEFAVPEGLPAHRRAGWAIGNIGEALRRFREYIIEKGSIEEADKVISSGLIDSIQSDSKDLIDTQARPAPEPAPAFSSDDDPNSISTAIGDADVNTKTGNKPDGDEAKQFSQEDVDALEQTAREKGQADAQAEAKRDADAREFVSQQVSSGRLTPGMAEGLPELLSSLASEESDELSFASGDETTTVSRHQYLKNWVGNLPDNFAHLFSKQAEDTDESGVDTDDAQDIAARASAFQASEEEAGRKVSISAAVQHVTEGK